MFKCLLVIRQMKTEVLVLQVFPSSYNLQVRFLLGGKGLHYLAAVMD